MASPITWTKKILLKYYPEIEKNGGVDLDGDKKIKGNEIFADLDGNKKIDEKDFWIYLERNKELIKKQIEFVAWGEKIPSNNIIHTILSIESQVVDKETIKNAYDVMTWLINKAKESKDMLNILSSKEKMNGILSFLYRDLKYDIQGSPKSSLFSENISEKSLDCDTRSFALMIMADELKWPIFFVHAPKHMFMRWQDNNETFNYDVPSYRSDKDYRKVCNISDESIQKGIYLKNLSFDQFTASIYLNRAIKKADSGDIKGDLEDCAIAIILDPNYIDAYINIGNAKMRLGYKKGAIEDYLKAIELDPNSVTAYNHMAIAKMDIGDIKEAIEYIDAALKIEPKKADSYLNRGIAKYILGDLSGAIKDYSKAISLDQNNTSAYNNRGQAKRKLKDYKGAVDDYVKSIILSTNINDTNEACDYILLTLVELKQLKLADDVVYKILSPYADCVNQLTKNANSKYKSGDFIGALLDYSKVIKICPTDSDAYNNRATTKKELGDYLGAVDDLTIAIKLNSNKPTYYYNRGNIRIGIGDIQGGNEDINKAKALSGQ